MPKISIVMPVYNAEPFLDDAILSVMEQSFGDWELICVNDGSTDGSLSKLEAYASKDPRIRVFSKPNGGLLNARNDGARHACGKWLYRMDADDLLSRNVLEEMVRTANETGADYVISELVYWCPDQPERNYYFNRKHGIFQGLSGREALIKSLMWEFHGKGICRLDTYLKCTFDSDYGFIDEYVTRLVILNSQKIAYSEGAYYYRQHVESLCHKPSVRRFHALERSRLSEQLLLKVCDDWETIHSYRCLLFGELIGCTRLYLSQRRFFDKDERRQIVELLTAAYRRTDKKAFHSYCLKPGWNNKYLGMLSFTNWTVFRIALLLHNHIHALKSQVRIIT